jgi:hypothetical protein
MSKITNSSFNYSEFAIIKNQKIVIKKTAKAHKTIKERFVEFYGENEIQKPIPQTEIDWGEPVGGEI